MTKKYNAPVSIQVYLGSGKSGSNLRDNILKLLKPNQSLSDLIVTLLKKADPSLFKGVNHGKE